MSDAKNGAETVTGLSDGAAKTVAPNDRPDGPDGQAPDGPDGENTAPVVDSDRNRKGQFTPGNPGGPGRGRYSKPGEAGAAGGDRGRKRPDVDLISMMLEAIERRGDKFFDELLRRSPVAASQLLASLSKNEPAPGTPGGEPVNIIMGNGLTGIASAIMQPRAPDDVADLDVDAARQEVVRLRDENKRLMDVANNTTPPKPKSPDGPLLPETSKEAIECPDCATFVNIKGRMIEPHSACKFCGQLYDDSVASPVVFTRYRPVPDLDDRPRSANAFVITADSEGGWQPVRELSAAGIREALSGGGRGLG